MIVHGRTLRARRGLALTALAVAGVVVGAVLIRAGRTQSPSVAPADSAAFGLPRPASLAELVADYDVIVVGSIEGVQRTDAFPASGRPGPDRPPLSTAPLTFFDLRVERVVSAPVQVREGATITMRMWGPPDSATSGAILMPKAGDRRLFLLRLQRDGVSYGTTDAIFNIDGGAVTYADEERTSVRSFTDKTAPDAFIRAVREERDRAPASQPVVIPPTATPRP